MTTVWLDGRLHEATGAALPVLDHAVTLGDGVFETLTVVRGVPFAVTRHVARLVAAATTVGLDAPDPDVVRGALAAVMQASPGAGRLRVTWTAGDGPAGPARGEGPGRLLVTASAAPPARPVRLWRAPWVRNERSPIAGVKSTSYQENVVARAAAERHGASEALLADTTGRLSEGATSNVLVSDDEAFCTPSLATGCLPGVTRALLLAWSSDLPARVRERDLPFDALDGRALAVTSSVQGVAPAVALDGKELPADMRLVTLAAAFAALRDDHLDP
ncbi:aminotransferase class IV [Sanguibacter sp. A247]|uniref:aminotransferase class IV n=1 Tax=unclassified Sanguibacter TaxID=2645534 RepID=UPI003FD8F48D